MNLASPPDPYSVLVSQSQDCTAAALACSKILKELSKEEEDTDSSEEMLALADEFEHRAIGESPGDHLHCHRHLDLCMSVLMLLLRGLAHGLDVSGQYRCLSHPVACLCCGYHLKGRLSDCPCALCVSSSSPQASSLSATGRMRKEPRSCLSVCLRPGGRPPACSWP